MIDLHIHTTNSDGEFGVVEILEKANLGRLDVISITDHNNINAYDELNNMDIKRLYSGKVIPGVELEFVYNGRLFDMLGYGIDLEVMKKSEIIKEGYVHSTIEGQSEILDKLKHVCDELGIKYSLDLKISKPNHMANDVLVDDILKYSDNKDILDSMNIVDRSSFYRKHFCEVSSPFYIDQTAGKKDIFYVTSLIHDAGGLCFLAHPFVYNLPNIKETLDEIVSLDIIDGIECAHRKHTEEQINFLIDYCNEHNLKKSGGSDFHIDSHFLGYANKGSYAIEKTLVNDWIKLVKNYYM